ncbi:hypothetical protein ABIB00_007969, partial [Bradyrhizobium sp. LB14.3]|uniref:hypothetical protein n=1 Tax=Bradyrhizobium sp. LB14.3 TaxID=3156328 RepID=UPI00339B5A7C
RAELFAEIDRPKLGALPDQPYVFARWKRCRVARGLLAGRQLAKGQPWQIELSDEQISQLRNRVRRTKHSKKEAS